MRMRDSRLAKIMRPREKTCVPIRVILRFRELCVCFYGKTVFGLHLNIHRWNKQTTFSEQDINFIRAIKEAMLHSGKIIQTIYIKHPTFNGFLKINNIVKYHLLQILVDNQIQRALDQRGVSRLIVFSYFSAILWVLSEASHQDTTLKGFLFVCLVFVVLCPGQQLWSGRDGQLI